MAGKDLRCSWENATPLHSAVDYFFPGEFANCYQQKDVALSNPRLVLKAISLHLGKPQLEQDNNAIVLANAIAASIASQKDFSAKKKLREWALKGKLAALGYSLPRQHEDKPVLLNQDVWTGSVDWQSSEVKGKGLHYTSVKLVEYKWRDPSKKRRPGRPSDKDAILIAFEELLEEGLIDWNAYQKDCYPDVRKRMARNNPDKAADLLIISGCTINKYIRKRYNEEKAKALNIESINSI